MVFRETALSAKESDRRPAGAGDCGSALAGPDIAPLLLAVEHLPGGVLIVDATGRIDYANSAFARLCGCSPGTLIGTLAVALADQSPTTKALKQRIMDAVISGKEWHGEYRGKASTGRGYWVSVSVMPFAGAEGVITHYVGVVVDITEHKRLARDLDLLRDLRRDLLVEVRALAATVDLRGTLLHLKLISPEGSVHEPEGFPNGMKLYELVVPGQRTAMKECFERAVGTGTPQAFEVEGTVSGSWYAGHLVPLVREGQTVAVNALALEIAASQQAQPQQTTGGERFRRLAARAIGGIAVYDDGRILDANETFAKLGGYHCTEIIGMDPVQIVAPECRDLAWRHLCSGSEAPLAVLGLRKDGTTFPMEICGKSIVFQGRPSRVLTVRSVAVGEGGAETPGERLAFQASASATGAAFGAARNRSFTGESAACLGTLSCRELEVLRLVAEGLSDRDIGARLGISARTVEHHVGHILTKLDAPNRTAAVVAALMASALRSHDLDR